MNRSNVDVGHIFDVDEVYTLIIVESVIEVGIFFSLFVVDVPCVCL
jgi:hypothetical protein